MALKQGFPQCKCPGVLWTQAHIRYLKVPCRLAQEQPHHRPAHSHSQPGVGVSTGPQMEWITGHLWGSTRQQQDQQGANNSWLVQPVHPKGSQPWIFTGRTDAEAEAPILWPPDVKSGLSRKDPDAGKDWGQEEKGMTEDEMVGTVSPTQWTWVSTNSGIWWRTGKPGVLQSLWSQRVGHNLATELNWTENDSWQEQVTSFQAHLTAVSAKLWVGPQLQQMPQPLERH